MVGMFGAGKAVHLSPKDLGLSVGISGTISDSLTGLLWAIPR